MADRRARTLAGVVVGAVAVSLTGCGLLPPTKTSTDKAWDPATTKSLQTWLHRYDSAHTNAFAKKNPGAVSKVEGGVLLQASRAGIKLAEGGDTASDIGQTYHHGKPTFYLPAFQDYPIWMVSDAIRSTDQRHQLGVSLRQSADTDWRTLVSVPLDKGVAMPALAERDGHPSVIDTSDENTLMFSPAKVGARLGAIIATPSQVGAMKSFVPNPLVTQQAQANAALATLQQAGKVKMQHNAKAVLVRALATKDGGALVLLGIQENRQLTAAPGNPIALDPAGPERAFTGKAEAGRSLHSSYAWQAAILVGPKGSSQPMKILGITRDLTDAKAE